jgi:hypothetical protein
VHKSGENITERIRYYTVDSNKANLTSDINATPVSVMTKSDNFNNGVASNLIVGLNFKRDIKIPQNPFTINASSNLALNNIMDSDNTNAADATEISGEAKFYYGRVSSIDYVGSSPITATMRFEGYCGPGCNTIKYNALNSTSKLPTVPGWYINSAHNNADSGSITSLIQDKKSRSISINPDTSVNIVAGRENTILSHNTPPYKDDIIINTQSWLVHDKSNAAAINNKFSVEFIGPGGGWAGVGQVSETNDDDGSVGRVINNDTSNRTGRIMDW